MSERIIRAAKEDPETFARIFREEWFASTKKEAHTMQVEYNGFTGELVKLERKECIPVINAVPGMTQAAVYRYDLSIYGSEKKVTISADGVKLEDVKFLGGAVSFGG